MANQSIDVQDGMVVWNFPMQGAASGGHMELDSDQAAEVGIRFIVQARRAAGRPLSQSEIRQLTKVVMG